MKINEIIKVKRLELGLTQEQVAELLKVSTPAVNKWERGVSFPDITSLPSLARLLKVDLNTLLSFEEDMTDKEVGEFVNIVSEMALNKNFLEAYELAMDKIQEYPTSSLLIFSVSSVLESALMMSNIPDKEKYQMEIDKLHERVLEGSDNRLKYYTSLTLARKWIGKKEYEKAQEIIDSLVDTPNQKNVLQATLFSKQKQYDDASRILEEELMKSVMSVTTTLQLMMDIALKEEHLEEAEHLANVSEKTAVLYDLWEYTRYTAHFQLAIERKNVMKSVKYLAKMLKSLTKEWDINASPLYKHIKTKKSNMSKLIPMIVESMKNEEENKFLKEEEGFNKLLEEYSNYK